MALESQSNETVNATELVTLAAEQNPQIALNFTFYNETSGLGVVEIEGEEVKPERKRNLLDNSNFNRNRLFIP